MTATCASNKLENVMWCQTCQTVCTSLDIHTVHSLLLIIMTSHGHHGVSNHHQLHCLFNHLSKLTSQMTSALLAPCEGIHRLPVDSCHKGPVTENLSMSWRHHVLPWAVTGWLDRFPSRARWSHQHHYYRIAVSVLMMQLWRIWENKADCLPLGSKPIWENLAFVSYSLTGWHLSWLSHISGAPPLYWRHNDHDGISNHQHHGCLLNRLFRRRSKKTSKLRVTGLCVGNSPGTGEFPAQMASNAENVSIWWRHHGIIFVVPSESWGTLTLSQWSSSGNPVAIQCVWNLDPSVHWNATEEMPVCFQWSSSGFPVDFQCVPIMQINTGSPLGHHWVQASASVVPVASQCTCGSSGLPVRSAQWYPNVLT